VQQLWPGEPILRLDLGREVTQHDHSRHLRADQYGAHQKLEMGQPLRIAADQLILLPGVFNLLWVRGVKFEQDEITLIRHVMAVAVRIVRRVRLSRGTVGELVGGMRKDRVPPIEEFIGVAGRRDRVVPCSIARRDCIVSFIPRFVGLASSPDPPNTLMVIAPPLIAFCNTLCTLAPVPRCSLLLSSSNCPRRAAIASPGPKMGQKSNGAGSVREALR
jgi:hypothetical protein